MMKASPGDRRDFRIFGHPSSARNVCVLVGLTHAAGADARNPGSPRVEKLLTRVANTVAHMTGKPVTFIACCCIILIWALTGPLLGFSDTWQLIINTGTTVVTFLMVFLIQNTQNRDAAAIHAKLDDLISSSSAENAFIGIEHMPEDEVEAFRRRCEDEARKKGKLP